MHKSKKLSLFLILFLFIPVIVFSEELVWLKSFDAAKEKAQLEKKPILVFVTAKWCSFCTMMHNSTLTNATVTINLEKFIRVEIDYDQNLELCAKWDATSLPTTILFNQFGEPIAKESGFKAPNDFNKWLSKYEKASLSNVSVKESARKGIQKIFDKFKEAPPADQPTMFVAILDSYFQQKDNDMKEFVVKKIIDLIQINTNYFEILLNHSRLEARILASTIIEQLKLDFNYDPWETTENRREQIKLITPKIPSLKAFTTPKLEAEK